MLEIKNITKIYETDGFSQRALDGVSVNFRESEFASILGPSGSGKTTFLNIIGGLDHYTSGDLIINEMSTKKYKDSDWDSYRNHRIGFVFQSYNLISHQSILSNVSLALTLSGISKKEGIKRAKEALIKVGLEKHMYKRPNQLSGGQMQRVAIARALVNNPDILLADEPTGALDSKTSVQIMELLKEIAKTKLVIMVTHNPDLAKEYSTRIITLKDGKITSDTNPYDGSINTRENRESIKYKTKKTNMSRLTALSLSFNNLMTKKGRTILVAFAGSIGIIGIALISALSNGFQKYVDKIGEDTLTSYPLNIMQEQADIAGTLLSMTSTKSERQGETVEEQQYITSMLKNISTNDLKSFKKYVENNYSTIEKDVATIKYNYSVEPLIYTIDGKNKLAKVNPSNLFSSMFSSNMMQSFSSYTSIYSEMLDNYSLLNESYDILKGRWPEKYDELVLVLPEANTISDLLVYSLGLRDINELSEMINKIMSGETVEINHEPLKLTYDELMKIDLRLIKQTDTYKYNNNYKLYEDMTEDDNYMKNLYEKALRLKIVGIVTAKEGVTSMALSPGVNYRKELTKYIIDNAKNEEIVKKQLANEEVDVISGNRFDKEKGLDLDFKDLITVDNKKIESAFNIKIDEKSLAKETENYMKDISNSISVNTLPAHDAFSNTLNDLIYGLTTINEIKMDNLDEIISSYLNKEENAQKIKKLEEDYGIPKEVYQKTFSGLLKAFLEAYHTAYSQMLAFENITEDNNMIIKKEIIEQILPSFKDNTYINATVETMFTTMTEAKMNKEILTKVGGLTSNITNKFANAFSVDADKIASAFKLKYSEEEITRVVSAMMTNKDNNAKTNLISLGYQDLDEPTIISFYFNSFDGKERFLKFLDDYNEIQEKNDKDKVINYSDTTGILMSSVKTIVDAVSYVLIGFVSISLVVSSIMIGIITYISVFERTKEIGILRAIGASKKNISSIFNAETFIIGMLSGLFGIGISYLLIPIINKVIHHFTGNIPLNAYLSIKNALILIILSIILTLIGGFIPARSASKKDPVEALRSE